MKLNSAQLDAFFAAAKFLNFTKAAEYLHITQSALSQRIAKLEEDIEATLFVRGRANVSLTEAGYRVLRYCQLNAAAESELLTNLRGSKEELIGTLRIAGFSSVNRSLVMPALQALMTKHLKLSIKLVTKEIWELPDLLRRAEADYIVTSESSDHEDVESIFLGYEKNFLARSKRHANLEIFLDHDETDPTTKSYFKTHRRKEMIQRMRYLDDVYGLIDGVKLGYGMAVLPYHLIEREKDIEILDHKRVLKIPIYLRFYRHPFYRSTHSAVVSEIQKYFRSQLDQT